MREPISPEQERLLILESLETYNRDHARHTLISRVLLLSVIFGGIAMNLWMTDRNYDALIISIDHEREASVDIFERTNTQLATMEDEIQRLQTSVSALEQRLAEKDAVAQK